MKTLSIIKGTSGAGKSTRVYMLLLFLRKIGYRDEVLYFTNKDGKEKQAGILVPDLDLLFIGNEYKSGEFSRYQGADNRTSSFCGNQGMIDFVNENKEKYHMIFEGAVPLNSDKFRPDYLFNEAGVKYMYFQYYLFVQEQRDKFDERIIYRSGKKCGDSGWQKVKTTHNDFKKSEADAEALQGKANVSVFKNRYDEEVYDFGMKMLVVLDLDRYIGKFISFCRELAFTKNNNFFNFLNWEHFTEGEFYDGEDFHKNTAEKFSKLLGCEVDNLQFTTSDKDPDIMKLDLKLLPEGIFYDYAEGGLLTLFKK